MRLLTLFILILFTFSCGSKKSEEKTEVGSTSVVQEIELTGNDQMQYNLKKIEAAAGSTIKLTLKHIGQMTKDVMGHNFVLLKKGIEVAEFATAAMSAKATDYIPPAKEDQVIAHTKLIGGGESTSIEFTVPSEPGVYKFLCSFPGHYVLMQGDFIVK